MANKLPDWAVPGTRVIVTQNGRPERIVKITRVTASSAFTPNLRGGEYRWVNTRSVIQDRLQMYGTSDSWHPTYILAVDSPAGQVLNRQAEWNGRRAEVEAAIKVWREDASIRNTETLRGLLDHWAMSKQAEEVRDAGQGV